MSYIWAPTNFTEKQELQYISETMDLMYEGDSPIYINHPSEVIDTLIATGLSDFDYVLDYIYSDQWFAIGIKHQDNLKPSYKIYCHSVAIGLCFAYKTLHERTA